MNIQKIRTENLLMLAKKYHGLKNLANACGKNNSYFSQIFNQTRPFTEKFARQIEKSLNLEDGCLDQAEVENQEVNIVNVPEYNIRVSAGNGEGLAQKDIIGHVPILRDLILTQAGNSNDVCILKVSGDSMIPLLSDGSRVLIDTGYKIILATRF